MEQPELRVEVIEEYYSLEERALFKNNNPQYDYKTSVIIGALFKFSYNTETYYIRFNVMDSYSLSPKFIVYDMEMKLALPSKEFNDVCFDVCCNYFINKILPIIKEQANVNR